MSSRVSQPLSAGPPLVELAAVLDDDRSPILLDSGDGHDALGRWHLLMFDPREVLTMRAEDPGPRALARVADALERHFPGEPGPRAAADEPPFTGGAAGWLAYDLGRQLERLPARARSDADVPDLFMGIYPFAVAEEVSTGRRLVVGRGEDAEQARFLESVARLSAQAAPLPAPTVSAEPESTFEPAAYRAAVERVREHILDGDVYQVNLAQRFELPFDGPPEALLAALSRSSPAAFGACLRRPGVAVVSNSPELFLRRRGTRVESRPIKGTRPRGRDAAEDARLRAELEASPKETAELSMIVDLVRNDLGRTAALGSVEVELPFETDPRPTVFHRVATVACDVPLEVPSTSVVEAAFPPASVTGTPKIRALEVIEDLEPVRRHVYCGALGWIGADGDMDLSVAIRIATRVGRRLLVPVGGGITLGSEPQAEYEETLHKARALFDVLGQALPDPCATTE